MASRNLIKDRITRKIKDEREDPETRQLQQQLCEKLGMNVSVERRGRGKRISIDFFSEEELKNFVSKLGA